MKLLKKLYLTPSPSEEEKELSDIVVKELTKIGIKDFTVDEHYQIYKLIKDTPLVCAHMDQVKYGTPATMLKVSDGIIYGNGNLGADDKNGVWILLKLLKHNKNLSFIFSSQEEIGGRVIKNIIEKNKKIFKTIKYGLVFDRRGHTDIIGRNNDYCSTLFEHDLKDLMEKYGYTSTYGSFSDCNKLSDEISCINISCGYYLPHTDKEFTILVDLFKSLKFGKDVLKNINIRYSPASKPVYTPKYNSDYSGGRSNYRFNKHTFLTDLTDHTPYHKTSNYSIYYKCTHCENLFSKDDLIHKHSKKSPCCWEAYIPYLEYPEPESGMEYEEKVIDNFKIGDEVIILSKSEGEELDTKKIKWRRWDKGFVSRIQDNKYYFLSLTQYGKEEPGLFLNEDLCFHNYDTYEDDTYDDDKLYDCVRCKKSELIEVFTTEGFGFVFNCPRCNFTFPTIGSCEDVVELRREFSKYHNPF